MYYYFCCWKKNCLLYLQIPQMCFNRCCSLQVTKISLIYYMVCLFYSKKQIAPYDYNRKGSYTDHYVSSLTKCFSRDVCNRIVVNVLRHSCSIARNKLPIIFTNPTGNNLTANIFWQMLCTSSNKILINVHVYSIARNKLLITNNYNYKLLITGLCTNNYNYKSHGQLYWVLRVLTDVVHLKNVTKSSLKYYGMLWQETNCSLLNFFHK